MDPFLYPGVLSEWNVEDTVQCMRSKYFIITSPWTQKLTARMKASVQPLLRELQVFFRQRIFDVGAALAEDEDDFVQMPGLRQPMEDYLKQAEEDYTRFLGILDTHIARVGASDTLGWKDAVEALYTTAAVENQELLADVNNQPAATTSSLDSAPVDTPEVQPQPKRHRRTRSGLTDDSENPAPRKGRKRRRSTISQ